MPDLKTETHLPSLPDASLSSHRLTMEQQAMVYSHLEEGKLSHPAIAQLVGVTKQTIAYYANRVKITPKSILRSQGHSFVQAWLRAVPEAEKRGDIRPMERALLYGGHLEPLQADGGQRVVVQIGVQLGLGQPAELSEPTNGIVSAIASTIPTEPT